MIYYTGKAGRNPSSDRLSPEPHYFGTATIGERITDPENSRNYYCEMLGYQQFESPVLAKRDDGTFLETIPDSRKTNYWRFGVREISRGDFDRIVQVAIVRKVKSPRLPNPHGELESFSATEGKKKVRFSSYYERNPMLRQKALEIHGYSCMACGFNFEDIYGEIGRGFIHVHHNKPISMTGRTIVNPREDLSVLCPNCHAMVHRDKTKTLSLVELKAVISS